MPGLQCSIDQIHTTSQEQYYISLSNRQPFNCMFGYIVLMGPLKIGSWELRLGRSARAKTVEKITPLAALNQSWGLCFILLSRHVYMCDWKTDDKNVRRAYKCECHTKLVCFQLYIWLIWYICDIVQYGINNASF